MTWEERKVWVTQISDNALEHEMDQAAAAMCDERNGADYREGAMAAALFFSLEKKRRNDAKK